eukprot:2632190-Alexandrium_andersonii.AAC.1
MWSLGKSAFGDPAKVLQSGMLSKASWSSEEQRVTEEHSLLSWGVVVGMRGNEENALAALKRKEIYTVKNPKTPFLYSIPKSLVLRDV